METARVDIRKLQLLNDRINQTIDALNQVRLSVHGVGLAHSAGYPTQFGPTQFGGSPFGTPVFGVPGIGLGHTSPIGGYYPGAINPQIAAAFGGVSPYAQQLASQMFGGINPLAQVAQTGLGHTSPDQLRYGWDNVQDPFSQSRGVGQTFPFAAWGYSPFASQMF